MLSSTTVVSPSLQPSKWTAMASVASAAKRMTWRGRWRSSTSTAPFLLQTKVKANTRASVLLRLHAMSNLRWDWTSQTVICAVQQPGKPAQVGGVECEDFRKKSLWFSAAARGGSACWETASRLFLFPLTDVICPPHRNPERGGDRFSIQVSHIR